MLRGIVVPYVTEISKMNTKSGLNRKKTDPFAVLASSDLSADSTRKTNGETQLARLAKQYYYMLLLFLFVRNSKNTGEIMGETKRIYGTPARIAEYFMRNPGKRVSIFELMQHLNLNKDQVQTAMHRIKNIDVKVETRGQIWSWTPAEEATAVKLVETAPEKNNTDDVLTFWSVGKTRDGREIIRETDGDQKLYYIEEL